MQKREGIRLLRQANRRVCIVHSFISPIYVGRKEERKEGREGGRKEGRRGRRPTLWFKPYTTALRKPCSGPKKASRYSSQYTVLTVGEEEPFPLVPKTSTSRSTNPQTEQTMNTSRYLQLVGLK